MQEGSGVGGIMPQMRSDMPQMRGDMPQMRGIGGGGDMPQMRSVGVDGGHSMKEKAEHFSNMNMNMNSKMMNNKKAMPVDIQASQRIGMLGGRYSLDPVVSEQIPRIVQNH
jgi:hypothetical protein